jgi:hypothetical protein
MPVKESPTMPPKRLFSRFAHVGVFKRWLPTRKTDRGHADGYGILETSTGDLRR